MKKRMRLLGYYSIPILISVLMISFMGTMIPKNFTSLKRPPLINLWGITLEDIMDDTSYTKQPFMDSIVSSLSKLRCGVTTRIVYNPDSLDGNPYNPNPDWYDSVTAQIKTVSKVMGLFLDSESWSEELSGLSFGRDELKTRLIGFMDNSILKNKVDIWEIGNESNGTWVHDGDIPAVQSDLDTLFRIAKGKIAALKGNKQTALTLFYYPSEGCVEDNGNLPYTADNYMMLKWATNFVTNYPDVVKYIDYVFISYYPLNYFGCDTLTTVNWYWQSQIDSLSTLFPNSLIGFGEVGWDSDNMPTLSSKLNIVDYYYTYAPPNVPIYNNWTTACFYWNYQTDCFDSTNFSFYNRPVWRAIDSIMGECTSIGGTLGSKNKDVPRENKDIKKGTKIFKYSLSNNYPNPFNPTTRIDYSIPRQSFVSFKVYDILGKEVKTLVNDVKLEGQYSIEFNASDLPSGVYFYKLTSGDFSDIKRMILVK
ncbi:MAG: T9SS type A sorting domain-containing protein [Ignavibacteria bacterium]|nr:T9SS type A sorting domain-containing protein [Ignavibacteria bacterium]